MPIEHSLISAGKEGTMKEGDPRPKRFKGQPVTVTTLSLRSDIVKLAKVYAVLYDTSVSDVANMAIARFIVGDLQARGTTEEVEATVQRIVGRSQVSPSAPDH